MQGLIQKREAMFFSIFYCGCKQPNLSTFPVNSAQRYKRNTKSQNAYKKLKSQRVFSKVNNLEVTFLFLGELYIPLNSSALGLYIRFSS